MEGQNVIDINVPNIVSITIIWFLGVAVLGAVVLGARSLMGMRSGEAAA